MLVHTISYYSLKDLFQFCGMVYIEPFASKISILICHVRFLLSSSKNSICVIYKTLYISLSKDVNVKLHILGLHLMEHYVPSLQRTLKIISKMSN